MFTFCHAKSVLWEQTLDFAAFLNLWLEAKLVSSWSFVSRNEESIPETKVEEPWWGRCNCVGNDFWYNLCFMSNWCVFFLGGGKASSEHVTFSWFAYDLRWLLGWSLLQNPPKAPHQWHWSLVSWHQDPPCPPVQAGKRGKGGKGFKVRPRGGRPGPSSQDDIKLEGERCQKLNF